jgi:hypothetical protein
MMNKQSIHSIHRKVVEIHFSTIFLVFIGLDPRTGRRNRGRPRRRWDQEFREVVGNQWSRIARDRGK